MSIKSPLQQHGPGRIWMFRTLVAVLVVVSTWLVFEFGRISAGYNIVDANKEKQALIDHIDTLDLEIADLKQQIAILETNHDVDRASYKEVEASLGELQAKIQEQRDAIAFYRGIVSPSDGNSGLRVQNLELSRGNKEREFNLRLVLVQAMKHDRKVSGDVKLSVAGSLNGIQTSYTLADLLPEEAQQAWVFSFRYFQDFERRLVLPDGFTPERITVEVISKTRSISSIEASFDWAIS